jgi:FkbM family methyltransferase
MPSTWSGEALRWYLTRARHPFKDYIVGHYWSQFCKCRLWVRYDDRSIIRVRLGDYLQQRIFFDGFYERPLIEWLKRELQPEDVFWDVGANIGAVSLVAARRCARVVAFEPDPRSIGTLRANIAANDLHNIDVRPIALGAEKGVARLFQASSLNSGMTSLIEGRATTVGEAVVDVQRADDLVGGEPELQPTIIKIDVEGAEHLVLAGAEAILGSRRVRAIVFEDKKAVDGSPANIDLLAVLQRAGYQVSQFGPSDGRVDDGSTNYIAIPD